MIGPQKLERNITLYSWFKILIKRVYLPLITVYLVDIGHLGVDQLAIIATVTVFVQLALQIPTGYIADKYGNRVAVISGSILMTISPLCYMFMPNFAGGLAGAVVYFGGYSFLSGAIEAFIHDTLIALKREQDYSKIMGKAQSYGLIGNVVLISLVPATYVLNPNLPFILGFIAQVGMLVIALNFNFPPASHQVVSKNPIEAIKKVVNLQNIAVFVFAGLMAGVTNQVPQYRELLFQDVGINVEYFGLLLAIGSVMGAILGWYIHIFDKISPNKFYLLDLLIIFANLCLIGLTRNQFVVVAGFSLFVAYGRVRLIIVQAKLLKDLQHVYKATLLSALSLFTNLGDMLVVTFLAGAILKYSYVTGYLYFSFEVLGVGLILWGVMWYVSRFRKKIE
jgi:MFS family permease